MSIRIARWVVVCAGLVLLLAANSGAQTSSIFKVSDIEGGAGVPGMSMARCGPGIVVGFADGPVGAGGWHSGSPGGCDFKKCLRVCGCRNSRRPYAGFQRRGQPSDCVFEPEQFLLRDRGIHR